MIDKADRGIDDETTLALANLFSPDDYLELMLVKPSRSKQSWQESGLLKAIVDGSSKYVVPYLTDQQLESIRKRIRKTWDPNQEPATDYESLPWNETYGVGRSSTLLKVKNIHDGAAAALGQGAS